MNRLFVCSIVATAFGAIPAQVQSLTVQSQDTNVVVTQGARPDGTAFGGRYSTGTADIMWEDGKKTSETYSCIGVTMPPNAGTGQWNN